MAAPWDLEGFEAQNGLRFTWNEWPATVVDAAKAIIPIAAIYTPMRFIAHIPSAMDYEPARCKQAKCGAVMNPYWCVCQRFAAPALQLRCARPLAPLPLFSFLFSPAA